MLRGVLATITGFILLYWPVGLFFLIKEKNIGPGTLNAMEPYIKEGGGFYVIAIAFITGMATRAISCGRFIWTLIPYLAPSFFIIYSMATANWSDFSGDPSTVIGVFLFIVALFALLGRWGWNVMKKIQIKKAISRQNPASNSHLV